MYHFKQPIKVNYQMEASSSATPSSKSRGLSLFDRQAQLHAHDPDHPSNHLHSTIFDNSVPFPPLKSAHSASSPLVTTSSVIHHHQQQQQQHSPILMHHRPPLSSSESYPQSTNNNVQLLSVHPRPESNYIKEIPATQQFLETDFPLIENSAIEESENSMVNDTSVVEQAFDYLTTHDDDDDVIHKENDEQQQYHGDSFDEDDSVDTIDLDVTKGINDHQNDSGIHTLSSTGLNEKRHDNISYTEEKLTDHQSQMACSSRGTVSEDYDSDFDNSSHEDDEPLVHKDSLHEHEEEQKKLIILQRQQILWGIVQEWSRKEESYSEQLKTMEQQLNQITIPNNLQSIIQELIICHKNVYQEIEDLHDHNHQLSNLTEQLTHTVDTLMQTLPLYDDYIKLNLAPVRKSLEKRTNTNGLSSEDLLTIPPKQFLQILSQVQDLYQTAQSFESDETENTTMLYNYAQRCRLYGSRQDENINKIILKNEDVATMAARGNRDRCRLILYPDAIVACNIKPKLLASPKYVLLWFIPMLDLQWTIPQGPSDDNVDTGDDIKSNLKSAYKELEKTPKTNNTISSRISKSIRKQENEYNLAQSKLQLILSSASRSSMSSIILFSSAYQRQDWIDLIDKTKQDLFQRSSATLNSSNNQRLNDSIIQKRLDFVKPHLHETNSNELPPTLRTSPQNTQATLQSKTYSGTLCITIHSLHGAALCNPIRQYQTLPLMSPTQQQAQKNYQFYVAVEVDSYNTFYPYAQTAKQMMQHEGSVEFKGEIFQVELEYSLAFRLLIYRIDTSISSANNSLQRALCIGKFHRNIETALHDCKDSPNGVIHIESPNGDLKLKISLKHSQREGTFKRQGSKRSLAVFGKSIQQLTSISNGLIEGIPRIIVKCIQMVDRDGLNETGIYRVCCVTSDLQKLRHQFDRHFHRGEEMLEEKNVHVAANLLKLFFRELPEPLFTSTLYKQFLHAIQLTDIDNQRVTLLQTLELLQPDNRKILLYLLDHLIRVSQYSHINMMHLDNLAVVFGPTLMRPSKLISTTYYSGSNQRLNAITTNNGQATQTDLDQMSSELQGSMYQCQVVLACLKLRKDGILQ